MIETIPGYAYPIDFNDRLIVSVWNLTEAAEIETRIRTILPNGQQQVHTEVFTPTFAGARSAETYRLDSGWLIGVSVIDVVTGSPPGDTFVRVTLERGETASPGVGHVLIAGYLTEHSYLSWPGVSPVPSFEGNGGMGVATQANPAAGANLSMALSAFRIHIVDAIHIRLVTDANVANRRMILRFNVGATIYMEIPCSNVQAASLTYDYYFGGVLDAEAIVGTVITKSMAPRRLDGQYSISTAIENIQVADQISQVRVLERRWFTI